MDDKLSRPLGKSASLFVGTSPTIFDVFDDSGIIHVLHVRWESGFQQVFRKRRGPGDSSNEFNSFKQDLQVGLI